MSQIKPVFDKCTAFFSANINLKSAPIAAGFYLLIGSGSIAAESITPAEPNALAQFATTSVPLWFFLIWTIGGIALAASLFIFRPGWLRSANSNVGAVAAVDQLVQNFPDAFALWDENDQLVACNDAYQLLYKIPDAACVRGTKYDELRRHAIKPREVSIIGNDESRVIEARFGEATWIELKEKRTGDGGYVSINRDISKRKTYEAHLTKARNEQTALAKRYRQEKLRAEQSSDAKTNFLAHLSHDVRTPLNHIIGFADLMAQQAFGPLGDARYTDYAGDIKNSGESLLKSFTKILELAELDSGHVALEKNAITLHDLLTRIDDKFCARAIRAKIKFTVNSAPDILLHADAHSLERAIGNLIDNALKFTSEGGTVSITTWLAGDGLVLEITDSGIGMSPERLRDVQQPFSMGDAMFARSDNALGIGLSVARGLTELHGGAIGIESSLSIGTTVAMSLPVEIIERAAVA